MRPLVLLAFLAACMPATTAPIEQPDSSTDADADGHPTGSDCNDADPQTHPGAAELCDGRDNDCDGETDEDVLSTWHLDADSDGHGGPATLQACTVPPGYVANSDDCDDLDPTAHPDAAEACDGADNDCDGETDEDTLSTFYADADADGHGGPASVAACAPPSGTVANSDDCDDDNPSAHPGAAEVCDGADNDCDGSIDEDALDRSTWYTDDDGDGYGSAPQEACTAPEGASTVSGDCDDSDAAISPAALEVCDDLDNDCDGDVDDAPTDALTWFADSDGDGYGTAVSTRACTAPTGYTDNSDDCDDGDARSNPDAPETCDGADNDCDGETDEGTLSTFYTDGDGDGHGGPTSVAACAAPSGTVANSDDCDDSDPTTSPNGTEVCDGADNDCDGSIDEDALDRSTWYTDGDGDGYGTTEQEACTAPEGTAGNGGDCDDGDAAISPAASEVCDDLDNDCDGRIDNGVDSPTAWYRDADGDGYGTDSDSTESCTEPSGYAQDGGDCDDGDAAVNPGAAEAIDGIDNNCDSAGYDGSYHPTSDTTLDGGVWEFTDLTIPTGVTVTVVGSASLELYVLGDADISGTLDLSGSPGADIAPFAVQAPAGGDGGGGGGGMGGDGAAYYVSGYPYGVAEDGDGDAPGAGGTGYSAGSGGGGGGQVDSGQDGGGTGGCYTRLSGGVGGSGVHATSSPELLPGSGGGGGGYGTGHNADGGGGGGGGGALYLWASDIDVSGAIYCGGGDGGGNASGTSYHGGGGGGGSGGTLWLVSERVAVSGALDCQGGAGGLADYGTSCGLAGDGGEGADGVIYVDATRSTITGSTTPSVRSP